MKKLLLVATTLFFGNQFLQAQQNNLLYCGQGAYVERLKAQGYDPEHDAGVQALEAFTENFDISMATGSYTRGSQTIYIIPIVFHIVHKGGVENIPDANVIDQVAILNRDYNKMNADTSMVVATFANNIANVGFEFRLAQKDALGNCTNGINHIFSLKTDAGDNSTVDDVNRFLNGSSTNTSPIRFPRNKYLNVWVCNDLGDAAGYTNNPSTWMPAAYDGIWLKYSYCGSLYPSNNTTSRALTHEIGHWMNLSHTWGSTNNPGCTGQTSSPCNGDNNCLTDDGVSDTPNTIGWTTCNLAGKTCMSDPSPVDNVQNYMDYSYCSRMFTNGQKSRMIAAITSGVGQRSSLWTPSNLTATGVNQTPILCSANFIANNIVICEGESVDFTDLTYNAATGWNWTFTGGTPSSSNLQNETVTYNTAGNYTVTLTSTDGTSTDTETKTAYITVLPSNGRSIPFVESFETVTSFPSTDWVIENPDSGQAWSISSAAGYTGTKSAKLGNTAIASGNTDDLISSTIDMSSASAVLITFKYSFLQKSSSNTDILKVFASNDCGATWSMRKQLSSSVLACGATQTASFTPSSISQWEEAQITNITSSYFTPNFRLKFTFESGGGNNIYIDDINIMGTVGMDDLTYDFGLSSYPNPFDSQTTISFNLDNEKDVELNVYDVIGKHVMNLTKGHLSEGNHTFNIDGSDLDAGVYFVKLKVGNIEKTLKVIHQ